MIKKVQNGLSQRKVKLFLLFLGCSALLWFVNRLSETYTHRAYLSVQYRHTPDSLMLLKTQGQQLAVDLQGVGFQFLGLGLGNDKVTMDLSHVRSRKGRYYLAPRDYWEQVQDQLPQNLRLLQTTSLDTLYMDMQLVYSKTVPIRSRARVQMAPNFLLEDSMQVQPREVVVTGPQNELDTLTAIWTEVKEWTEQKDDFVYSVPLIKPAHLQHSQLSDPMVTVRGKVSEFSEKIISVPVSVLNNPEGFVVKTFPAAVDVLCQAPIEVLKQLQPSDLELVANFSEILSQDSNRLVLNLRNIPDRVYNAKPMRPYVEFVLTQE